MISRILSSTIAMVAIGLSIIGGFYVLDSGVQKALLEVAIVLGVAVWLIMAFWRRYKGRQASKDLQNVVSPGASTTDAHTDDVQTMRKNLDVAINAIKSSRLGRSKGAAALYELPWYMIIGNPSAGKSSAIANSGLTFPLGDQNGQGTPGIGGTRNCDWFFTTEGILLDTAGRYSVHEQGHSPDRKQWLAFLSLLRKHRPRAPINGIIIAVSIVEISQGTPEFSIDLAQKLRLRIQELTDHLEVIAPVYVIFTKADLISGFSEFFSGFDDTERQRVWGSTFSFQPKGNANALAEFETCFDDLVEGVRELGLAQMAGSRGQAHAPGLLQLPMEFAGVKAGLRTFLTALFEANPYQHHPVVRGIYFTSALQQTATVHTASRIIEGSFGLKAAEASSTPGMETTKHSYFLLDLFRKVIFADRQLVQQYSSVNRARRRYTVILVTALLLGLGLTGWAWSYTNNRQLVANVEADLQKVIEVQKDRIDLQSRVEALEVLQDRLEQLQSYRKKHPMMLGLGLYQGGTLEAKLRYEYLRGMYQIMLSPVTGQIETYLAEVIKNAANLRTPGADAAAAAQTSRSGGLYQSASPTNVQDGYNALKAYLMLSASARVEPVHLSDQLTRFWRHWLEANRGAMDREAMARSAERLMTFYMSQSSTAQWPTVETKMTLVDDARQALSAVMNGLPARDRVYAEIKARAATRFPSVTVASLLPDTNDKIFAGSYAISGAFSREAWEGYVKQAIRDASNRELNTTDWVLHSSHSDDLTLSGSPEHLQKDFEQMYAQEYITEWRKFLQGITVANFVDFNQAATVMNLLGDPQNSPMKNLLEAVHRQTSWDNVTRITGATADVQESLWDRLKNWNSTPEEPKVDGVVRVSAGTVGDAFSGIARLTVARDDSPSLLQNYLDVMSRIRTRLNAIKTQGDPGPGARELMLQTLDATAGSELSAGLTLVDEQVLMSIPDAQRRTLRPLLLWPMMQTFSAIVPPAEREINRVWKDQVYDPFTQSLAGKYPFAGNGQIEATSGEMAEIFGPQGAISRFASESLGPLVIRRGNTLASKQWADVGITLSPSLMASFAQWVSPLGQTAEGGSMAIFQILPGPATGFSEYTLQIGDQLMRYRNMPAQWSNFSWDSNKPSQVAKVSVVTFDGRTEDVQSFIGHNALGQLIKSAQSQQNADGSYELNWVAGEWSVPVSMKIVSNPRANADGSQRLGLNGTQLPVDVVGFQVVVEGQP